MAKLRPYKAGKYGKGMVQEGAPQPQAAIWRVKGWDGPPHHEQVTKLLKIKKATVAFHIDQARWFYFHAGDDHHRAPKNPRKLAKAIVRQHPALRWGKLTVEQHEAETDGKQLAMNGRPLRPFEQGAHLHVLDWAHETARARFQAAGKVQVKAAAKAAQKAAPDASGMLQLPSLQAALHGELRSLYAVGHATVHSELDHQQSGDRLPVGLSQAPDPPNLRMAEKPAESCATCKMFDHGMSVCWGFANKPVLPEETCDNWFPEPASKLLAQGRSPDDPGRLRVRSTLAAQAVAHAIWQAVQHAKLSGVSDKRRLRLIAQQAGDQALSAAASSHAGGAINAGRRAAAEQRQAQIVGARYTSVLDKNTCAECADADTGILYPVDDPALIHPPNPTCASIASGTNRCRCILVYQLSTETGSRAPPVEQGTGQPDEIPPIAKPGVAAVGVGSS